MSTSTVTSKGQTTIPKAIRKKLGLQPGDRIEYIVESDGRVFLLPATHQLSSLAGALRHRAHATPLTLEEIDEAIRRRPGK
jgi:antitoxin PrlF